MTPNKILKKYFGYDEFRAGQIETINYILNGADTLSIMPTGSGKSVCYQIPAIMLEGVTIVISPLISLMKDQVDALAQAGISAEFINSSQSYSEQRDIMLALKGGYVKILYIAPERLEAEDFRNFLSTIDISVLAVDEAHCVSGWGHDFRPSYLQIKEFVEFLPNRPKYSAFTATATPIVRDDIIKLLGLKSPHVTQTGFDRPNLYFSVMKPKDKHKQLLQIVADCERSQSPLLVYTSTRKFADTVTERLIKAGKKAVKYHAGMSEGERAKSQNAFINDSADIMVATNAFGMGIDKSNIRHVVHYNMPKDLESYYQEAGRAGRDGSPSKCTLLFSAADIVTARFLINSGESGNKSAQFKKLSKMADFCNTGKCLRKFILDYFGDTASDDCHNCGNCGGGSLADITIEAQKVLSCVRRMKEGFGQGLVCDVLKGSKSQRIIELGFDKLSTYKLMEQYKKEDIRDIISYLLAEGYLTPKGDEFPVLKLTPAALSVLKGEKPLYMKKSFEFEAKEKAGARQESHTVNDALFTLLRELRKTLAKEEGVPPFVVFSDKTLTDMCKQLPINYGEFLQISGVGEYKAGKYCDRFVAIISKYVFDNNLRRIEE